MFVRIIGTFTLRDLETLVGLYVQVHRTNGRLFALFDSSRMDGVERSVRKALGDSSRLMDVTPNATAVFGASFALETLGNMVNRALEGLGRKPPGRRFFDTEAQARAYIEQERQKIMKKQ